MLANDTVEHRTVVLKIPRPGMLDDAVFRAAFVREAALGLSVRSPFVAKALRFCRRAPRVGQAPCRRCMLVFNAG